MTSGSGLRGVMVTCHIRMRGRDLLKYIMVRFPMCRASEKKKLTTSVSRVYVVVCRGSRVKCRWSRVEGIIFAGTI